MLTTTMGPSIGANQSSTVTSQTILNVGLQMQGKQQLNNQMLDWQRRMDEIKQVERSATANKLIFERNLRMMELAAKQGTVHHQQQCANVSHENVMVNNSKQIMVPILVPMHMPFQFPTHIMASLASPTQDQQINVSPIPHVSKYPDDVPHLPLPQEYSTGEGYQSSCNKWLQWHKTIPPTSCLRKDSVADQEVRTSYDPSLLLLDYLPFTSEDDIPNIEANSNREGTLQIDEEEEENFNVIL